MKSYIHIETTQKKFDRSEAIKAYKAWQELKLLRKKIRKFQSPRSNINSNQVDIFMNYKQLYNSYFSSTLYRLIRIDKGEIFYSGYFKPFDRRDLINSLGTLNRDIRDARYDIKRCTQNIRVNPNYWFFRQMEDAYSDKHPKTEDKYIGIEIECIIPSNWSYESDLIAYRKYLSIASDGSINCEDMESEEDAKGNKYHWIGKEFRILAKESELENVVKQVTHILVEHGAQVNTSCGLHVHFDMRHTTDTDRQEIYSKLYHSLALLKTIVPSARLKNQYCRINTENTPAYNGDRYKAINPVSYQRHRTFEVRLFNGTVNAEKILNWVNLLKGIINGKPVLRCPKSFDAAKPYWNISDDVVAWAKHRQVRFAPHITYGGGQVTDNRDFLSVPTPMEVTSSV